MNSEHFLPKLRNHDASINLLRALTAKIRITHIWDLVDLRETILKVIELLNTESKFSNQSFGYTTFS